MAAHPLAEAAAQELPKDQVRAYYDFDSSKVGFYTPDELGMAFFKELQGEREMKKLFSTKEVYYYMIHHAQMKHGQTVIAATDFYWNELEQQREQYCKQLLENIDSRKMDMKSATLQNIRSKVEKLDVKDEEVYASDIEIIFRYENALYSILLDDCGKVKGKWFVMTPFVLWQGQVSEKQANEKM